MPIYEFYCPECHTVFSFLSRKPNTRKRPSCPACRRPRIERRASSFAISRGQPDPGPDGLPGGLDDERMERLMTQMASGMDGIDEDDPRQMARVMRRLFGGAGIDLGPGMEEAMRRMEAGEDPDLIEEELGDQLEAEDGTVFGPTGSGGLRALRRRLQAPSVDPTLHEL